jgi:LysR family transcriptional regulator, mexEF-oprN operon transcriptional activator
MDIDLANIKRLDISTLVVFDELVKCQKTTLVAARVGLSQSAISHAIKRLRSVFQDQLFVRRPDGMDPTPRAREIAPQIAMVLETLKLAVRMDGTFDAGRSDRLFRIAANDLVGALLAGPLLACLKQQAPMTRLAMHFAFGSASLDALRRDEIDLAVGRIHGLPDGFTALPLFEETFVVVAREAHPSIGPRLTLDTYLALDHLLVSFRGGLSGIVDRTLERQGLKRRVVGSIPMFLTAFAAVARSDAVATVPSRLAHVHATMFGLNIHQAPFALQAFAISAVRHHRTAGDKGVDWLSERIVALCKTISGDE